MASCSDDDDDDAVTVSSIRLSQSAADVEVGTTLSLSAITDPEGVEVQWASTNPDVATVDDGMVTAVATGTATISAKAGDKTAACDINVFEWVPVPNPFNGSNFYLFMLDGQTAETIAAETVADFRPDDQKKNYWIWDNTYSAGSCVGSNSLGLADSWVSLVVGNAGWSGDGYNVSDGELLDKLALINSDEPEKYYFHIAVKASRPAAHLLILSHGDGNEAKMAIGGSYVDNNVTYPSRADIATDGSWTVIEIPMTEFFNAGLAYRTGVGSANVFSHLSGGVARTTFEYDAAFIYKKNK